ncbi:MAG: Gfo/Idh/MocA family oxidoreductase [Eubacteriales bacterium]|nr:Gfo/Idh/MocA family oxidoreductase [Eubacteriales bacterium]
MKDCRRAKIRFAVIGAGWRAQYYLRIAAALKDVFEVSGVLCRSEVRCGEISGLYGVPVTMEAEEIAAGEPDLVVVAVSKTSICEVTLEWAARGFPVLCETPAAMSAKGAEQLKEAVAGGAHIAVAEQYARYATLAAELELVRRGLIGRPEYLYLSQAHDYHGASLIRAYLDLDESVAYEVVSDEIMLPTAQTLTRMEEYHYGVIVDKLRVLRKYRFAGGQAAVYDFDSEQYRSPIRSNLIRILGERGEMINGEFHYLDEENAPRLERLEVSVVPVRRDTLNPNFRLVREVEKICFQGEVLYEAHFGLCGLTEDETAIATMLWDMDRYVHGCGPNPYPVSKALFDCEMAQMWRE